METIDHTELRTIIPILREYGSTLPRPNILLVVLDSVRKDHLTPYGYERATTPTLEWLSATSTTYTNAISTGPWTAPSHASLFTGLYPSNHGVYGRSLNLDSGLPTVAEGLSEAGYQTFGFSNSYHTSVHRGFDRGFDTYHDYQSIKTIFGRRVEFSLPALVHKFRQLGGERDQSAFQLHHLVRKIVGSESPFFGFINFSSAHSPYDPPAPFREQFESGFKFWDSVDRSAAEIVAARGGYKYMMGEVEMDETEWDLVERWYDGEIAYVDSLLENLFESLRDSNNFENTMIVVTADHGEHFGENGLAYHQFSLSEELLNVPLLIKWPSQDESAVSNELVSLADFPSTFLDIAGVERPELDGRSLYSDAEPQAVFAEYGRPKSSILENLIDAMFHSFDVKRDSIRERLLTYIDRIERYDRGLQAIRTRDHKLVSPTSGKPELYRIDEGETITDDEAMRSELQSLLDERLTPLPTEGDDDTEIPDHIEARLVELGYRAPE